MHEFIHPQKNNTKNSVRGAEIFCYDGCANVEDTVPLSRRPSLGGFD